MFVIVEMVGGSIWREFKSIYLLDGGSGNYLLDHVDGVPFKDRKLFFISIIQIIHRREFDVKSFGKIV